MNSVAIGVIMISSLVLVVRFNDTVDVALTSVEFDVIVAFNVPLKKPLGVIVAVAVPQGTGVEGKLQEQNVEATEAGP